MIGSEKKPSGASGVGDGHDRIKPAVHSFNLRVIQMRYCPICERTYVDEITVCEVDGAILRESGPKQDPLVGKIVRGRYRVLEKIGEGGMGTVYLAEQLAISRKVAFKLLHPDYARDQEFVRRFRQEAKLAASLNHRNIITVFDFDQADDGSLYIVMEYVAGQSLNKLIQQGPMDLGRALRLAIQIGEGLKAAHGAGVIHRDIKPENVMVVGEEEIKLMDFGIARLSDTEAATRLTRPGMIMGTPTYMAPEQIEGGEVGTATDIYAFGIVLYEILSGSVPFTAPTPSAILVKHLQETAVPLRKLRKEIPASLEKVVKQALEKRPDQRQKSMDEVVELLVKAQRETVRERTATSSAVAQQLMTVGRRLNSIPTLMRRLFERASTSSGQVKRKSAESTAPKQHEDAGTSVEAWQTSTDQSSPVAESQPLVIAEPVEPQPAAPVAAGVLLPRRLKEHISSPTEQPVTQLSASSPATATLVQDDSEGVYQPAARVATSLVSADSITIAQTVITTSTQPVERHRAPSWRLPGLSLAAAMLIGLLAIVVYRHVGNQPIGSMPLTQPTMAARTSAEKVELTPQSPPVKANPAAEKTTQEISRSRDQTDSSLTEKTAAGQVRLAPIPPPASDPKTASQKRPEAVKESALKERANVVKVAPAAEAPYSPKVAPQEIKVAEKPKEAEPEKFRTQEPAKKESETKLASIEKPASKQPEISLAPPESRLLSLAIISGKRDINVRERVLLTVKGKYSDGKENEIAAGVRWDSSDANVAVVNSRGELEGRKEGKAEIKARYGGVVSSAYIFQVKGSPEAQKVEEPGDKIQDQRRRLLR